MAEDTPTRPETEDPTLELLNRLWNLDPALYLDVADALNDAHRTAIEMTEQDPVDRFEVAGGFMMDVDCGADGIDALRNELTLGAALGAIIRAAAGQLDDLTHGAVGDIRFLVASSYLPSTLWTRTRRGGDIIVFIEERQTALEMLHALAGALCEFDPSTSDLHRHAGT